MPRFGTLAFWDMTPCRLVNVTKVRRSFRTPKTTYQSTSPDMNIVPVVLQKSKTYREQRLQKVFSRGSLVLTTKYFASVFIHSAVIINELWQIIAERVGEVVYIIIQGITVLKCG